MPSQPEVAREPPQPPLGVAAPTHGHGLTRPTLDARPLALVLVLAIASGALLAALLGSQRTQALAEGEQVLDAFASVMDDQTTRTLQTLEQRMEMAAQLLLTSGSAATATGASARAMLDRQMQSLPFMQSFTVLDAQGQVAFSSPSPSSGLSLGPDEMRLLQSRPGTRLRLDAPQHDGRGGPGSLRAARPFVDSNGTAAGVVIAVVQAAYFDTAPLALASDSGSALALLRTDGTLLLRIPPADVDADRTRAFSQLMVQHLPAKASGNFRADGSLNGQPRLMAYRTLAKYPELVVVVSRSVDAVLAPWRQRTRWVLGVWTLAMLALAMAAVYLGRALAQRRGAEQQARQIGQQMVMASEAAGIVVWDSDAATDTWNVTPTYYTTLGLEPQGGPVDHDAWLARVHPEDQPRMGRVMETLRSATQDRYVLGLRLRHADGSYRTVQEFGRVVRRDAQGAPAQLMGVRIDVTEATRAQLEREQMLNRVSDAFVALDTDWRYTYVNTHAGELFDRDPKSLVGKHIWTEFPEARWHRLQLVYEKAMALQQPEHLEEYDQHFQRWFDNHIYPSPNGLTIYFRDISQRKAAEFALRQAKENAESLIANASVMIVGLDAHGQVTLFNQAAQALTGYTLVDLAGRNWFEVLCPHHLYPAAWSEFERLASGGPPLQFENPILTRDGQERIISWQNNVLHEGDTYAGCLSFGVDVTARRLAEKALAESRDQFETLTHNSLEGIALVRKGQLVYTNPAFRAIAGRSKEELAHFSVSQLMQWVHPDDRAASIERQRRVSQGEPVAAQSEMRIQLPDGQWRWVLSSVRDILLGAEPAMLSMMLDIHDRKLAEDALRESEERFRSAFESSAIGISLTNQQGKWLKVNPALCRIVGYTEAELLTLNYEVITHPDDRLHDRQLNDELLAGERSSFKMEKRYLHKDGHVVWVSLTVALVRQADRIGTVSVAQVEDISWRKSLERDLHASQARLSATIDALPDLMFEVDMDGRYHRYHLPRANGSNRQPNTMLGKRVSDVMPPEAVRSVMDGLQEAAARGHSQGRQIALPSDRGLQWFELSIARKQPQPAEDVRFIVLSRDITDRKLSEIREVQERDIMHYLASDRPLADLLQKFVLSHEAMVPGMMGSVLLVDSDGHHLRHGAAPHLPPAYLRAIDGMPIGPAAGSCGTAAFTGEPVITTDIATDPRWKGYRAIALSHQLRACWSVPIRGMQEQVLGAFAFYFDHVREPTPAELSTIERGAQLASQAIERHLAVRALQASEERYRSLVEWSPEGIGIYQDGILVYANPAAAHLWGAPSARDVVGKPIMQFVHPDDQAIMAEQTRSVLSMGEPTP
ncbi:MAG: PAS domain S-box protein, partial [Burkholderiaceae bacterium]